MIISVEIEDAAGQWNDVSSLIEELTDGTGDADQVIPEITLQFRKRPADPDLFNPSINKWRPRIRVTEGELTIYYLMERPQGSIVQSLDAKSLYGRAWAGVLDNLRPASFDWLFDTPASVICAQVAHQDIVNQSGLTVPIVWQATLDPVIPGGRYSISRASRREVIAEVAAACGARVRSTLDGLGLEVYDTPAKDGSAPIAARYSDGIAPLNYECRRQFELANAVRVQGEVLDYTQPTLPRIEIELSPPYIEANGTATATARARVYDGSGRAVQHKAIIDEAITAGSYSEIPVQGCYAVQGVWLNIGTQEAPVKGTRLEPIGFTASTITVAAQSTQLFIVSYTRAESVSWSLTDYQDQVDGEAQASTGDLSVSTAHPIGRVRGVYRATDTNRTGTNYFAGGSATANTQTITLGISPGATGTPLLIDYDIYNGLPVGASLSPTSTLVDSGGFATTTIGAGTTLGTAVVTASALGQSGTAELALIGSAIGSLQVTIDPAVLRARQGDTGAPMTVTDEACVVASAVDLGMTRPYVAVDNKIVVAESVYIGGVRQSVAYWTNDETLEDYRIYLNGSLLDGSPALANYTSIVGEAEDDQQATITAVVTDSAGDPVSDGEAVKFELIGQTAGASLDISQGYTVDGEVEAVLTAGNVAEFTVRVTAGPLFYEGTVSVVLNPTGAEEDSSESGTGGLIRPRDTACGSGYLVSADDTCCKESPKDSDGPSGSICGKRRLVGCDGEGLAKVWVKVCGNILTQTDEDGWFHFCCGAEGANTGIAFYQGEEHQISWTIDPAGSESRGESSFTEGCTV
ncbi:MAG: hypothetical protein SCI25_00270 [Desulfuromonadales bacterium]|nr:hypothetical protein [Desulfuromonadales bacterium]